MTLCPPDATVDVGRADRQVPERRDVLTPILASADPLGPWKTAERDARREPSAGRHAVLLRQFATVGIGPGFDVESQPCVLFLDVATTVGPRVPRGSPRGRG